MTSVKQIICNSWEDFTVRVARNQEEGRVVGGRVYRGQSSPDWPLSSKFERWLHLRRGKDPTRSIRTLFGLSGPEAFEQLYLSSFKNAAIGIPGLDTDPLSDDDWWALGRHHGLVTRLLDWTLSPYIAAFFAFADSASRNINGFTEGVSDWIPTLPTGNVVVWALAPYTDLFRDGEFEFIDKRNSQSFRQRAQLGVFTRLRHDLYLDVANYLTYRGIGHYLERIEIPSEDMGKALNDLHLMNITFSALFPDLDGAARETNLGWEISKLGRSGIVVKIST